MNRRYLAATVAVVALFAMLLVVVNVTSSRGASGACTAAQEYARDALGIDAPVRQCDSPAFSVHYLDASDQWYVRSVDEGYYVRLRYVDGDWQTESALLLNLP